MDDALTILVVSDSTGETAQTYLKSITTQFPDLKTRLIRRPDITTIEEIDKVIAEIPDYSVIVPTIAIEELSEYVKKRAKERNIEVLPIFDEGIEVFEKVTGQKALHQMGMTRTLSEDYFSMIEAIEFAIQYDDGRDPRGFLKSDIVLLGVSRTSKTPTTMILSTKGYKVSNLPLVPESRLPREIFEVDSDRLIGLIIDPSKLSTIRENRSKELGLMGDSVYYNDVRIKKELEYASEVYKDLDCKVIDVTNNTIEQTATMIVEYYKSKFGEEDK